MPLILLNQILKYLVFSAGVSTHAWKSVRGPSLEASRSCFLSLSVSHSSSLSFSPTSLFFLSFSLFLSDNLSLSLLFTRDSCLPLLVPLFSVTQTKLTGLISSIEWSPGTDMPTVMSGACEVIVRTLKMRDYFCGPIFPSQLDQWPEGSGDRPR